MKNITLSIKDIALLKQLPEEYFMNVLEKTHDGTSMGKIGPVLDEWMENTYMMTCAGFNEQGEKVYETEISTPSAGAQLLYAEIDGESKNIHCITNNSRTTADKEKPAAQINTGTGIFLVPGYEQLKSLTLKNDHLEYMLRSYSLASPDGTRMTVIRNDSFGMKDHTNYEKTIKDFAKDTKNYNNKLDNLIKKKVEAMMENGEYPNGLEGKPVKEIVDYARKESIKEYGSWEDVVYYGKNYPEQFEQCNTKFRIKHPS